ncbi:MAG TPA: hypothetical protein DGR97_11325 [Gammaproteobacteria bacterium]|nr:hypothetical protein [Gammaproteobacteria bacterium]
MNNLIEPTNTWLMWAAISSIAAFGAWSDKCWLGRWLSGAVVALLGGILLSNFGVIPSEAKIYDTIYNYLLPLAIPLVLFEADLTRIFREARRVLVGFLAGALGTVVGGFLAFAIIPLSTSGAEFAAAFTAAYVGGTANLLAVGQAVGLKPGDSLAAVVAAGNLAVILYLVLLFLARNLNWITFWFKAEQNNAIEVPVLPARAPLSAIPLLYSLAISIVICAVGFAVQNAFDWPGLALLTITFASVLCATLFRRFFATLDCASPLGFGLLHILFVAIGASASFQAVAEFGPMLMIFATVILVTHVLFVLGAARLFGLGVDETFIASNACALGAPTAAAMALSFRRNDLAVPAMLCGVLGYAVGNFVGLAVFNLAPIIR